MSRIRNSERGFSLAGLIVIMTIMAIVIAYTVPQQWSMVMARERDQQTLFAMKQYARAIHAFQKKNNAMPVSLDQLKEARNPRLLRGNGELICPLTGKADWVIISAAAVQPGAQPNPGQPQPGQNSGLVVGFRGPQPRPGQQQQPQQPTAAQPGGVVGPIAGVRPNKTGDSFLTPNGATSYDQWSYTVIDLQNEIQGRLNALMAK